MVFRQRVLPARVADEPCLVWIVRIESVGERVPDEADLRIGEGPFVHDREELVRTLAGLMERGCPLEEPYRSRVEAFFPFHDRDNCRRVTEAVLAADGR